MWWRRRCEWLGSSLVSLPRIVRTLRASAWRRLAGSSEDDWNESLEGERVIIASVSVKMGQSSECSVGECGARSCDSGVKKDRDIVWCIVHWLV